MKRTIISDRGDDLMEKVDDAKVNRRGVIYIGHLPNGFSEPQMRSFFKQFGNVRRVNVSRSKKSGKSRGYGFVEFDFPEVAQIVANSMNNYLLGRKMLRCTVVPSAQVHPNIFGSSLTEADVKKKHIKLMRERQRVGSTVTQSKLDARARKKERRYLERIKEFGITIPNPTVTKVVVSVESPKKHKSPGSTPTPAVSSPAAVNRSTVAPYPTLDAQQRSSQTHDVEVCDNLVTVPASGQPNTFEDCVISDLNAKAENEDREDQDHNATVSNEILKTFDESSVSTKAKSKMMSATVGKKRKSDVMLQKSKPDQCAGDILPDDTTVEVVAAPQYKGQFMRKSAKNALLNSESSMVEKRTRSLAPQQTQLTPKMPMSRLSEIKAESGHNGTPVTGPPNNTPGTGRRSKKPQKTPPRKSPVWTRSRATMSAKK